MPREEWSDGFPSSESQENEAILEERKSAFVTFTDEPNILDTFLSRYSSLEKIQRLISYMFRLTKKFRYPNEMIFEDELQKSLIVLVRHIQRSVFLDIISRILDKKLLPKQFRKLSLFLDSEDCLGVGGRLSHSSELSYSAKHPLLLPRSRRLTQIIIEFTHKKYIHPGRKTLHYHSRQQFWILSPRHAIEKVVSHCILCFRLNPKASEQIMGLQKVCGKTSESLTYIPTVVAPLWVPIACLNTTPVKRVTV